jgi:hypothetical protein
MVSPWALFALRTISVIGVSYTHADITLMYHDYMLVYYIVMSMVMAVETACVAAWIIRNPTTHTNNYLIGSVVVNLIAVGVASVAYNRFIWNIFITSVGVCTMILISIIVRMILRFESANYINIP